MRICAGDTFSTGDYGDFTTGVDRRKKQQAKAAVQLTIRHTLDGLPETYTRELYQQKCNLVYQHIFESY